MTPNMPENEWAEDLPPNCPPQSAIAPKNETFYRLVKQFPPTKEDFSLYNGFGERIISMSYKRSRI